MSGEIRQNKATKEWVIFAPARGKRPQDFQQQQTHQRMLPAHDDRCPFCPGNEHMLPTVLMEFGAGEAEQWQTQGEVRGGTARTPYYDVYESYKRDAEDAIARENVPPAYRDSVKEYFDRVKPGQ